MSNKTAGARIAKAVTKLEHWIANLDANAAHYREREATNQDGSAEVWGALAERCYWRADDYRNALELLTESSD